MKTLTYKNKVSNNELKRLETKGYIITSMRFTTKLVIVSYI